MKHTTPYLPILFLGLLANIVSAQISTAYQPMAIEGAHWICFKAYDRPWGDQYYSWTIRGDTMVNGQGYKKVYRDDFFIDHSKEQLSPFPSVTKTTLIALIRDQIPERKVFGIFLPQANFYKCAANDELLLFDFNLAKGDTLKSCFFADYQSLRSSLVVDSITYTQYNCTAAYPNHHADELRRTINVNGYWASTIRENNAEIMEGIGFKQYGLFFENWNGSGHPISPWIKIGGLICHCIGTDADCNIVTSSWAMPSLPIRIYPNPVEDRLYFEFGSDQAFKSLRVYHSSGILLKQLVLVQGQNFVDVQALPSGHFYLQGWSDDGKIYSGKFIKL